MRKSPIKALAQEGFDSRIDKHIESEDRGFAKWSDAIFERVFLQNYARVVSVIFRLVGDRARAEELAGDVFYKLYRRKLSSDREHNLGGWLYRAAVYIGLDSLRSDERRRRYETEAGKQAL